MSHNTTLLISGATSAIAQAFARRYAAKGVSFYLLARDPKKLDIVKQDLLARGASAVNSEVIDMSKPFDYDATVARIFKEAGCVDIALLAQGIMFEQSVLQVAPDKLREMYEVNTGSVLALAGSLANHFERQQSGTLLVISSVAGDRGRQSNYAYGSTKAAVSIFVDGLRHRLSGKGVTVVTVKPGFVDTPMTEGLEKGGPLWARPEKIAADMDACVGRGGQVLYTPWFWRYIMLIIRHIPEFIFKKMQL